MAEKQKLTLNINAEVLRRLKKLAAIERRSLSNYVSLALEAHIKAIKEG